MTETGASVAERGPTVRWGWVLLAWSIPAAIATLQSATGYALRSALAAEWPYAALQFPRWMTWALFTPIIFELQRRYPLGEGRWSRALVAHGLASVVCSAVLEGIWLPVTLFISSRLNPGESAPVSMTVIVVGTLIGRLVPGAFTYAAVLGIASSRDYQERLRRRDVRASQLQTQLARAELSALKAQVHPHFLFNTLHAITVLIRDEPASAIRMVTRLGDLLRLSLSRAQHAETTVQHEMELIALYLEIERVRFADRLEVVYDIHPEVLGAAIPDLILQPLVENAIKHGIAPSAGGGRIVVRAHRLGHRLELEVTNTGHGPPAQHADGVGLSVTRARLEHLHGDASSFVLQPAAGGGTVARVRIPFRLATLPQDVMHA